MDQESAFSTTVLYDYRTVPGGRVSDEGIVVRNKDENPVGTQGEGGSSRVFTSTVSSTVCVTRCVPQ